MERDGKSCLSIDEGGTRSSSSSAELHRRSNNIKKLPFRLRRGSSALSDASTPAPRRRKASFLCSCALGKRRGSLFLPSDRERKREKRQREPLEIGKGKKNSVFQKKKNEKKKTSTGMRRLLGQDALVGLGVVRDLLLPRVQRGPPRAGGAPELCQVRKKRKFIFFFFEGERQSIARRRLPPRSLPLLSALDNLVPLEKKKLPPFPQNPTPPS